MGCAEGGVGMGGSWSRRCRLFLERLLVIVLGVAAAARWEGTERDGAVLGIVAVRKGRGRTGK